MLLLNTSTIQHRR
uniref:Uncharacterized protein n=1 Tax=Arundo donax TaxID=35708 RepID=A0A0A8YBL9_ARUDO